MLWRRRKKKGGKEKFCAWNFFSAQNFSLPTILLVLKFCWTKFWTHNFFGPIIFFRHKIFFWPKNFLDPNFFWDPKFSLDLKFSLDPKFVSVQKNFLTKISFRPKIILCPNWTLMKADLLRGKTEILKLRHSKKGNCFTVTGVCH